VTYTDESLRKLVSLAGAVLGQDDLRSTFRHVTAIAVDILPDCDGASLTTFEDGRPIVAAADSEWSTRLDELQYEEREGPCLDATRTGNVFRIRDLAAESRWPFYCKRAAELGARSVASLPATSEGKVVGALNVYSRRPDAFDAEQVALGELMAAQAGVAMQVAASFFRHRDLAEQMKAALESRARIEQAKGVLVATRRCTPDEAFEALVQLSQTANRKLRDVAAEVVAGAQQPG
jgi:GAF domain-containing protein